MCMNVYTPILSYIHDLEHMYMCMICKGANMQHMYVYVM
jgi:hypothetical protein